MPGKYVTVYLPIQVVQDGREKMGKKFAKFCKMAILHCLKKNPTMIMKYSLRKENNGQE